MVFARCFLFFVLVSVVIVSFAGTVQAQTVDDESANDSERQPSSSPVTQTNLELPPMSPGELITFEQAILAADKRNLTLTAGRFEIEKADAQLSQARGLILPVVQGGMQYMRNDHEDTVNFTESLGPMFEAMGIPVPDMGDGDMVLRRQDILTGNIQAMMPLINLKSWYSISTAKKGVALAKISIENMRQQLLLGVGQAYFFALMSKTLIALYEDELISASHHLSNAHEKLDAGRAIRIDVIRAETDMEHARQKLLSAHKAFENARDTLGMLTGIGGLPMPVEAPMMIPPDESDEVLTKRALNQRPDVGVGRASVALAKRQLDTAWMQFIPSLDAGWQFQYQFTDPPDMGSQDRSRWAAMITLTVPIYNHFRYGDVDHKRATLEQVRTQEKDIQDKAALEVRKMRRNYLEALSSVEIAERQSTLAKEALTLVEESYAAGVASSLEVTDARRTYSATAVNTATQRLKAQIALLSLLHAVGENMVDLSKKDKAER